MHLNEKEQEKVVFSVSVLSLLTDIVFLLSLIFFYFIIIPGKTSLLAAIQMKEFPIPKHIDTFLLSREMPPTDKNALQCVIEVDTERLRLEKEAEMLAAKGDLGKY